MTSSLPHRIGPPASGTLPGHAASVLLALLGLTLLACEESPPAAVGALDNVAEDAAAALADDTARADAAMPTRDDGVGPSLPPDASDDAEADGSDASYLDVNSLGDVVDTDLDVGVPDPPAGTLETGPLGEAICMAGLDWVPHAKALEHLTALGVRRVRLQLQWEHVQPAPDQWNLDFLDGRVGPYVEAGIEVIGVLCYGNAWAASAPEADAFYPPDDPADFGAYVTAVTTHLLGRVETYEIWNEPNAGYRFFKPELSGDPEAFAALLKEGALQGRAVCPECRFAFGGPFYHSQFIDGHVPFVDAVFASEPVLPALLDAMGFHPYPLYPPTAPPDGPLGTGEQTFADMTLAVRQQLQAAGGPEAIWVTEVGWPVFGSVDAERQAAYLVRGLLQLHAQGVETTCWYNLEDGPDFDAFPPEDAFGLLTYGPEQIPKPAYRALAWVGNALAEHRITRDLGVAGLVPPGVLGFELSGPTNRAWAVWAPDGEVPVPLPATPTALHELDGTAITGTTLVAIPSPRYAILP